jgi:hypothetical protein
MPRIAKGPKVRLNLELTEEVRRKLEALREKTDADSLAEVIRRSLAVYDLLCEHRGSGGAIILRDEHGVDREVIIA